MSASRQALDRLKLFLVSRGVKEPFEVRLDIGLNKFIEIAFFSTECALGNQEVVSRIFDSYHPIALVFKNDPFLTKPKIKTSLSLDKLDSFLNQAELLFPSCETTMPVPSILQSPSPTSTHSSYSSSSSSSSSTPASSSSQSVLSYFPRGQDWLIKRMHKLYFATASKSGIGRGICFGFSSMWMSAFIQGEAAFSEFNQRLRLIIAIPADEIAERVERSKKIVATIVADVKTELQALSIDEEIKAMGLQEKINGELKKFKKQFLTREVLESALLNPVIVASRDSWIDGLSEEDMENEIAERGLLAKLEERFFHIKQQCVIDEKVSQELTEEDRLVLDILPFFEGIIMHHKPEKFPKIFPEIFRQDIEKTIPLMMSTSLEREGGIESISSFYGIYTKTELLSYFNMLRTKLDNMSPPLDQPIVLFLGNITHLISVGYNPDKGDWTLCDINGYNVVTKSDELIASEVRSSFFNDEDTKPTMFSTDIYVKNNDRKKSEKWARCIAEWTSSPSMQEINNVSAKAGLTDIKGASLLHMAARTGKLDDVIILLEKGANIDQVRSGVTPLGVACGHGNVTVVQALLNAGASFSMYSGELLIADRAGHMEIAGLIRSRAIQAQRSQKDFQRYGLFSSNPGSNRTFSIVHKLNKAIKQAGISYSRRFNERTGVIEFIVDGKLVNDFPSFLKNGEHAQLLGNGDYRFRMTTDNVELCHEFLDFIQVAVKPAVLLKSMEAAPSPTIRRPLEWELALRDRKEQRRGSGGKFPF
ncbi:ankyrin repeat domain-containing protein [Legionella sp. CNM-4043-24]|uniref:ankyrin repeat domain-containing protein n=1 Tax=Legionella sp. CNM-4043-24 TaxID=3421646 RepID=UPI00403AC4A8